MAWDGDQRRYLEWSCLVEDDDGAEAVLCRASLLYADACANRRVCRFPSLVLRD